MVACEMRFEKQRWLFFLLEGGEEGCCLDDWEDAVWKIGLGLRKKKGYYKFIHMVDKEEVRKLSTINS